MMVWPGGGGPVCHSSEVRKWNVTATGNLMIKEMHIISIGIGIFLLLAGTLTFPKCYLLNYKKKQPYFLPDALQIWIL